jgi:O-6-methylguanine DNA methyltransferase
LVEFTAIEEQKLRKLSPYQEAVLRLLAEVPEGKVVTYGSLAKAVAKRNPRWSPNASRAVGTAMKNNPCAPKIPCHRVVRSNGDVGNFRGGAPGGRAEKIKMLQAEGITTINGKINLKSFGYNF